MWDSTWIHVLQMNSNPSFWCASIWLAKRCSTCQWSAMVVCRFILHDSCNSTCEQSRIIQKCSSSCLWKVTQILKLQTLCQTLERPETQGGWPQVCRKTLRLRMQPSPDCLWRWVFDQDDLPMQCSPISANLLCEVGARKTLNLGHVFVAVSSSRTKHAVFLPCTSTAWGFNHFSFASGLCNDLASRP